MRLENETSELELVAEAFRAISKEISCEGLAKALLKAALDYSGAAQGAALLSERGELLAKADGSLVCDAQPRFTDVQINDAVEEFFFF
jgi:hypothetical protein